MASLADIFDEYDAILTPAAAGIAPKGLSATGDPAFCTLWTLTGLPSLSLPLLAGEGGLPLGVQLVGAPGRDARLLRTATALIGMLVPEEKRSAPALGLTRPFRRWRCNPSRRPFDLPRKSDLSDLPSLKMPEIG